MTQEEAAERARKWLEAHGRSYCPVGHESTRACKDCRAHDAFLANLLLEVDRERGEMDAKVVDGWHIKKGGYGNLAAAIRAASTESEKEG